MSASYNCSQFENVVLRKTPKSMFQKICRSQILYYITNRVTIIVRAIKTLPPHATTKCER